MDQPLRIDRYLLFREIAAGGMAAIWLARQVGPVGFGRAVAVKRLHPNYARDPDFVTMFVDEARVVTNIRHPNVVPVLDVVAEGSDLFLVMEYVHGEAASRLVMSAIRRRIRIAPSIVSAIGIGMLEGLHAAHEAKTSAGVALDVVHRDVSPQNVLVGVDGVARMVDFGIAQATSRLHSTTTGSAPKGKLKYMAPEQINAHPVDRRTDVWAAGVVLWELLAHRRLFTAENDGATIHQILERSLPPPSTFGGGPRALDDVVLQALRRPPGERFADARTMALALETACAPATAREVGAWVRELAGPELHEREKILAELEGAEVSGMPSVRAQLAKITEPAAKQYPEGDIPPGTTLGGAYSLVRPLGRGGMGTVYEGIQLALGRRVAIKVLGEGSAERAARFSLEAFAMAALQHPCIVQVSDFRAATDDEPPFLVMELLEGRSLLDVLREKKKLEPARAIAITTQVLSALATAHKAEIIHRDIKPANVFVTDHAGVTLAKVLDFGIAKMMGDEGGPNTSTGIVFGSLPYLAPERLLDQPLTPQIDIYSASVCLFEMLAGRRPFEGSSTELTALLAGGAPAPDVRNFEIAIPGALAEVVARGLARRPSERWPTADAMRDALMAIAGDVGRLGAFSPVASASTQAVTVTSLLPADPGRARWRWPLAIGLAAGLVGSAAVAARAVRLRPPPAVAQAAPEAPPASTPAPASSAPRDRADPPPLAVSAATASPPTAASSTAPAPRPARHSPVVHRPANDDELRLDHRK